MMSKKDQEHRDSTTDFFLKFISKEKENPEKLEEKHLTTQMINTEIDSKGESFVNGAIKVMNFINSTLDKMLQSGLSLKILSFILATISDCSVSVCSFLII